MKRTTLISASLLLAFAGCTCGQGWRPNIFTRLNNRIHGASNVGEPCDAGCQGAGNMAPPATGGCESCGANGGANYGGYDQVIDSQDAVIGSSYGGSPYSSTVYAGPINGSTVYGTAVPSDARPVSTTYAPTTTRMEPIAAKRAN